MLDSHRREGRMEIHLSLLFVRNISTLLICYMLSNCSNIKHQDIFAIFWAFEIAKYMFYKLGLKYPECQKGYELVT